MCLYISVVRHWSRFVCLGTVKTFHVPSKLAQFGAGGFQTHNWVSGHTVFVGFTLTGGPIGLAGRRLNRSAKVSLVYCEWLHFTCGFVTCMDMHGFEETLRSMPEAYLRDS